MPDHTKYFLYAIGIITAFLHVKYDDKAVTDGPTILTTLGIFATFVGVALGLSKFDKGNIQDSVPFLVDGLKTAFWASVAGIGGALTVKFRYYLFGIRKSGTGLEASDDVTAADLEKQLRGIQQALVGDDESTLVSQIKLSRQDTNDRLDALKKSQAESLQKLSEMGSKALVEALRDVIKDFNSRITEQFGENFKHLNEAVGKLLIWQEQHKAHIEAISDNLNKVVVSMDTASNKFNQLVEKSEVFTEVARNLSTLLELLQTQKEQLNVALKALAELLITASGSLPQIENKVMELTQQLTKAVNENQREVNKSLTENAESLKTLSRSMNEDISKFGKDTTQKAGEFSSQMNRITMQALNENAEGLKSLARNISGEIIKLGTEISKQMNDFSAQLRSVISQAQQQTNSALIENSKSIKLSTEGASAEFSKINQEFNKQLTEMAAKTKEQVTVLDAALSAELKKSLESLGRQLTALSEKFVADYSPLTERLRQIVQIAGKIQ
ncbi:MAG: hypothetical protein IT564_07090 [Rhodospirillales bacterium]|nr:hypothetical protein [Rhodospirillales bacterium]